MDKILKIALAEDHVLLRELLKDHLNEYDQFDVIYDVIDGRELFANITKKEPDLILLDLHMPVMDGWETLTKLKKEYPHIDVIILTLNQDDFTAADMVAHGAKAVLSKITCVNLLVDAIMAVKLQGSYIRNLTLEAQSELKDKVKPRKKIKLSEREVDILRLIMRNVDNHEIAIKLEIGLRTVEWHRSNILAKTNCNSIDEIKKWHYDELLSLF